MPVPSSKLRLALADGWPRQVLLFLVAYLVYGASRWVMTADEASALEHARSIVELEEAFGVAVQESVQRVLEGTAGLWLLNHAYLAAQVAVVPAALLWLYRRDRLSCRRLRDTVLATWLLALPVFWLFPVAPPHHQLLQPPRRRPVPALRLCARGLARAGRQRPAPQRESGPPIAMSALVRAGRLSAARADRIARRSDGAPDGAGAAACAGSQARVGS